MLLSRARDAVMQAFGSVTPSQHQRTQLAVSWYLGLSVADQAHVKSLVLDAVEQSVFGALVLLDGQTGGYPLIDQPSDFALYLQTYANEDRLWDEDPERHIRINSPNSSEDLHDIMSDILNETSNDAASD
jgi:hypothetical protein